MPVRQNRTQNPDWMKGDSHFLSVSVSDVGGSEKYNVDVATNVRASSKRNGQKIEL